jgi:hypothetical protein
MFEQAGVPSHRTSWANLRINGCDYNPAAFQIERPGSDLVARWFDEVGEHLVALFFVAVAGGRGVAARLIDTANKPTERLGAMRGQVVWVFVLVLGNLFDQNAGQLIGGPLDAVCVKGAHSGPVLPVLSPLHGRVEAKSTALLSDLEAEASDARARHLLADLFTHLFGLLHTRAFRLRKLLELLVSPLPRGVEAVLRRLVVGGGEKLLVGVPLAPDADLEAGATSLWDIAKVSGEVLVSVRAGR